MSAGVPQVAPGCKCAWIQPDVYIHALVAPDAAWKLGAQTAGQLAEERTVHFEVNGDMFARLV
jgi:hypothetical protein